MHQLRMYAGLTKRQLRLLQSIRRKWQVRTQHITMRLCTWLRTAAGKIFTHGEPLEISLSYRNAYP